MPFLRMPALRLRPVALGPGEPGYEDWKKAARAKFDAYDHDKNGWLTDEEAINLAVDLYATLHQTANLSSAEAQGITAELLGRLGHVDEKIVFAEFMLWFRTAVDKIYRIDAAQGCVDPSEKQDVADKFFHYDVGGQGYLGHEELLQVAQDLHALFNPGSGPLNSKELQDKANILMERIDGKGGNHNGRIEFEEFLPWYQAILDKKRALRGRPKASKAVPAKRTGPPPAPCSKAEDEWLMSFTDADSVNPGAATKFAAPMYHPALPKPGDKDYVAFEKVAKSKFDHYDSGKQGSLNADDILALAIDLNKSFAPLSQFLSKKDAEDFAAKLLKRIDKKRQGCVLFEDFLPWYMRMLDLKHRWNDAHDGADAETVKIVAERFSWYDTDNSGYLDAGELAMLVGDLHTAIHPQASPLSYDERKEMAAILLHRVDCTHGNGNGSVEFEEFMPWYLEVWKAHSRVLHDKKEQVPMVLNVKRTRAQRAAAPPRRRSTKHFAHDAVYYGLSLSKRVITYGKSRSGVITWTVEKAEAPVSLMLKSRMGQSALKVADSAVDLADGTIDWGVNTRTYKATSSVVTTATTAVCKPVTKAYTTVLELADKAVEWALPEADKKLAMQDLALPRTCAGISHKFSRRSVRKLAATRKMVAASAAYVIENAKPQNLKKNSAIMYTKSLAGADVLVDKYLPEKDGLKGSTPVLLVKKVAKRGKKHAIAAIKKLAIAIKNSPATIKKNAAYVKEQAVQMRKMKVNDVNRAILPYVQAADNMLLNCRYTVTPRNLAVRFYAGKIQPLVKLLVTKLVGKEEKTSTGILKSF